MVLITANKPKQLLLFTFAGHVTPDQILQSAKDLAPLVAELSHGFRVLADLTALESMTLECAPEIGKVMDLCAKAGVKLIVRVIPDASKDIGFTILSRFHYPAKPRAVVCQTVIEAAKLLDITP
jgi:hypothetical protein